MGNLETESDVSLVICGGRIETTDIPNSQLSQCSHEVSLTGKEMCTVLCVQLTLNVVTITGVADEAGPGHKRTLLQATLEEHHASIFYSQINKSFLTFY